VKYNASEQITEEMIKGFKAMSLSEPSETSIDFAQPVKAELSTHFFLNVSRASKTTFFFPPFFWHDQNALNPITLAREML